MFGIETIVTQLGNVGLNRRGVEIKLTEKVIGMGVGKDI